MRRIFVPSILVRKAALICIIISPALMELPLAASPQCMCNILKAPFTNPKVIVVVTALLMTALYFYAPIKEVSTWGISVFALLTALLILCFTQESKVKPTSSTARSLVWIGQRSYEMYLFHLIILGLMKVVYFPKDTLAAEKLMLLPVYFIAVFILSWVIEKYYSTPLNLKIRQSWIRS